MIELRVVTPMLAAQAAMIAARQHVRGCDAISVALAAQLGTTLVTLDREQLTRGTAILTTYAP